ncbi:MAG: PP2C family serine/threonine-protein phosphatase [Myxococcota bacterium]|nr:PP2C family serine/threonine-protein phosphatase [Myxococcota bacterium]
MRTATLRGREHFGLGRVACIAEGPCAIAISQGGAAKTYAHKDPNEDCAAFAHADGTTLLVVADGHAGTEAAELAIDKLIEANAPTWLAPDFSDAGWEEQARGAMAAVHAEIVARSVQTGSESRTTVSFALVSPRANRLTWASAGDSHVFRVGEKSEELGPAQGALHFLGSPAQTADDLVVRCGTASLAGASAVVLATDGLSEHNIGVADPAAAAREATEAAQEAERALRPLAAARGLAEIALAAQRGHRAGDNIATAVLWNGAD